MREIESDLINLISSPEKINKKKVRQFQTLCISEKDSILKFECLCDEISRNNIEFVVYEFIEALKEKDLTFFCYFIFNLKKVRAFDSAGLLFLISLVKKFNKLGLLDIIVNNKDIKFFFEKTGFFSQYDIKE